MDKTLQQHLQKVVEAFATGKTDEADAAIHEYLCRKSQLMLLGEAETDDDEDKDDSDESKDDEDSKDDSDDSEDEDEDKDE